WSSDVCSSDLTRSRRHSFPLRQSAAAKDCFLVNVLQAWIGKDGVAGVELGIFNPKSIGQPSGEGGDASRVHYTTCLAIRGAFVETTKPVHLPFVLGPISIS